MGRIFIENDNKIIELSKQNTYYSSKQVIGYDYIFKPKKIKGRYFYSDYNCKYFDPLEDVTRIGILKKQLEQFKIQKKLEEERLRIERVKEMN